MKGRFRKSAVNRAAGRGAAALVAALVLIAVAGGSAQGKVVYIHGKAYGEQLKPGSTAATSPFTVGGPQPPVTYGGGPLMLSTKLYLIFWGPAGTWDSTYTTPIIQYAKDLAADHAKTTNEFSIGQTYANGSGTHVSSNVTYGGAVFDTTPYPAIDTANGCDNADAPCLTDPQLQDELLNEINARGWPTDPPGSPVAHYLIYTPNGVSSCDGPGSCTFSAAGFCAYHSQITGLQPGNEVATYSNLPYQPGCDSGQAPTGAGSNPDTDGTLDSEMHEILEAVTDPSAGTGYTDASGNEVGDKCTQPVVSSQPAIYGTPLGGSLGAFTAFNQLIGTHSYYTQQIWTQVGTKTPSTSAAAGCVQRIGPSPSFAAPTATQHTGTSVSLNGSASSEVVRPITSYVWNYGDGSPTTTGVTGAHTYYKAGTYAVSLTVSDATGAVNASTEKRTVTVTGATLAPTISSFTPASGIAGTTTVTLHGSNLVGANVKFNGVTATALTDTATQITAKAPYGASAGKITVTTGGGTATSAGTFTPTLSVTSFSPASGTTGAVVTINGVGFNATSTVRFNGGTSTSVTHTSATVLKAVVPASATTGPIVVSNSAAPVGTTQSRTSFTKT
jgi:PKD repeat protein